MEENIFETLTQENLERFFREISDEKYIGLKVGLAEKSTDERILRTLATENNKDVKLKVAQNQSTPQDVLRNFVNEGGEIAAAAAGNPSIDKSILKMYLRDLARNGSKYAKAGVAGNPSTPESALKDLIKNGDTNTKINIAYFNSSASLKILKQLYRDGDKDVIRFIPYNPNITPEFLEQIYEENKKSLGIVSSVIRNASSDLMERIYEENKDNEYLLEEMARCAEPELLDRIVIEKGSEEIIERIAQNSKASPDMLKGIKGNQILLAHNPSTPLEKLIEIGKSGDPLDLANIADHSNIPTHMLDNIAEIAKRTKNNFVWYHLSINPNISREIREYIVKNSEKLEDFKDTSYNHIDSNNPILKSKLIMERIGLREKPLEEYSIEDLRKMEEDLKTQINEAKGEKAEVKAKVQEAKQAEALKQEEEKARAEEEAQKAKEDENAKAREEAEKRKVMDSILELNGELNGIYAEIDVERGKRNTKENRDSKE